ncbi:hypothetical protein T492DRAFT_840852 [Pavlovales sp. CCMP2436]|nr:hypothetical protein T492DRAFT_840852 [Pavlovales sp. CCMP2436]
MTSGRVLGEFGTSLERPDLIVARESRSLEYDSFHRTHFPTIPAGYGYSTPRVYGGRAGWARRRLRGTCGTCGLGGVRGKGVVPLGRSVFFEVVVARAEGRRGGRRGPGRPSAGGCGASAAGAGGSGKRGGRSGSREWLSSKVPNGFAGNGNGTFLDRVTGLQEIAQKYGMGRGWLLRNGSGWSTEINTRVANKKAETDGRYNSSRHASRESTRQRKRERQTSERYIRHPAWLE